ncbi:CBY1-interacting BAR domain-containing protein 2-like [Nelusetta ayraudi]|uniref:CBY1-interacting BAR domain-containing protein 2-like n=1 Tax=Nelusetta ayraudi TaxID=303726 RepID=UPI003F72C802
MSSFFSRDIQVKAMEQTVSHAEKHLGHICSSLASYARKTAKLRDRADALVAHIFDFSSTEGPEFQLGLRNLAEDLAMVQDYRQAQVERLETRVVGPLRTYGDVVKNKTADLRKFNADLKRETKEMKNLKKIQLRNPADRQSISQAEVSAQKASNNAQHSVRQLEEAITDFQRQKLEDIQRIFTDFVTVEMIFHAKALEVYTHTYHSLGALDVQKDLEMFTGRITMPDTLDASLSSYSSPLLGSHLSPRLASPGGRTLRSTLASASGNDRRTRRSRYPGAAGRTRSTLRRQRGVEEEEEEQEEEEDEDEEEALGREEEEDEDEEEDEEDGWRPSRQSYAAQYAEMRRRQK